MGMVMNLSGCEGLSGRSENEETVKSLLGAEKLHYLLMWKPQYISFSEEILMIFLILFLEVMRDLLNEHRVFFKTSSLQKRHDILQILVTLVRYQLNNK